MSVEDLKCLAQEFRADLDAPLAGENGTCFRSPNRDAVAILCRRYVEVLFPYYYYYYYYYSGAQRGVPSPRDTIRLVEIQGLLLQQICSAIRFQSVCKGRQTPAKLEKYADDLGNSLLGQLPELAELLASDMQAAHDNDPAASSFEEIVLAYPFIEAVTVQRFAHRLYLLKVPFLSRMMTEIAHSHTGIDIHPGASIGESFFIDHGTGVVIGETSIIGNKVTLYHGVTLGAFNPLSKDETGRLRRGQENKRHPTIEDHVTVYPNATILGGNTHIGHHSVIGGNVWLTRSVAPYSRVTVKDAELFILNAGEQPWSLYSGI